MSSWANFYRELANEAKLSATQATSVSEKHNFEEVAMEWSAQAKRASKSRDSLGARRVRTRTAPSVWMNPSHHGSDEQVFGAKQQVLGTGPSD